MISHLLTFATASLVAGGSYAALRCFERCWVGLVHRDLLRIGCFATLAAFCYVSVYFMPNLLFRAGALTLIIDRGATPWLEGTVVLALGGGWMHRRSGGASQSLSAAAMFSFAATWCSLYLGWRFWASDPFNVSPGIGESGDTTFPFALIILFLPTFAPLGWAAWRSPRPRLQPGLTLREIST